MSSHTPVSSAAFPDRLVQLGLGSSGNEESLDSEVQDGQGHGMKDLATASSGLGKLGPRLTVVIPVRNGGLDFDRCLRGLRASEFTDYELIVIDDGSTDDTAARAVRFGARVVRHEKPQGPAASRNHGAQIATSDIIFFVDGDVVLHPDTLSQVVERFQANPELAALFGSYDADPAVPGLVSQFRNLMHHFVHHQGTFVDEARPAHTFWTGIGAIRRHIFFEVGGFDPRLYRRPAIEDIEMGYRLTRAGHRIELVRSIQGTHLKTWGLGLMVKTDIFHRGVPWMLLLMRSHRQENDLNVNPGQKLCVAATGLAWFAALLSPWILALSALILVGVTGLIAVLNLPFCRFLNQRRGPWFATSCLPLHLVYYSCCGISVVIALALKILLTQQPEQPRANIEWRPVDLPGFPSPRMHLKQGESRWKTL